MALKLIEGDKTKVVVDEQNTDGLMKFSVNHEIKESKAYIDYIGPKIPKEEWQKILSFFKWTYDTYKSESQARLFVNPVENTWRAWVFPQEADTGMSAREMDCDDHRKQHHDLFGDDLNWVLFGTVHHHCSCSAFQSGTDRSNEENQDGLHITIGKMDEKVHDIHCRFYRKKWKLDNNLDMSVFWDVSDVVAAVPAFMKRYVPVGLADKLAREQMCEPSSVPFPEIWKSNVIAKPKPEVTSVLPTVYGGGTGKPSRSYGWSAQFEPDWKRAQAAWADIVDECAEHRIDRKALTKAIEKLMSDNSPVAIVAYALYRHKINIDELAEELRRTPGSSVPTPAVGGVKKDVPDLDELADQQWQQYCMGD